MGIDGIGLEPIREGSSRKLVEDTSLVDIQVVTNLIVSPVSQVPRIVIDL